MGVGWCEEKCGDTLARLSLEDLSAARTATALALWKAIQWLLLGVI